METLEQLTEVEFDIEDVLEDLTEGAETDMERQKRRYVSQMTHGCDCCLTLFNRLGALQEESDETKATIKSLEDKLAAITKETNRLEKIEVEYK